MELDQLSKEFGEKRVRFAREAKTPEDWKEWKESKYPFAFDWGTCWKSTVEYRVADFESEVGFYIDVLGFDCNTISDEYAMLMGPQKEFFLSVKKEEHGEPVTPPDSISIEFMIQNMKGTVQKLKARGIQFDLEPCPESEGSSMYIAKFRTPNGMSIKLWSLES